MALYTEEGGLGAGEAPIYPINALRNRALALADTQVESVKRNSSSS